MNLPSFLAFSIITYGLHRLVLLDRQGDSVALLAPIEEKVALLALLEEKEGGRVERMLMVKTKNRRCYNLCSKTPYFFYILDFFFFLDSQEIIVEYHNFSFTFVYKKFTININNR